MNPIHAERVHSSKPRSDNNRREQRDRNCVKRRYGVERVSWSVRSGERNHGKDYFPKRKPRTRSLREHQHEQQVAHLLFLIATLRILGYLPHAGNHLLKVA